MFSQQLLLTIFLPLMGAAAVLFVAPLGKGGARLVALATTLLTLWCAAQLVLNFPAARNHHRRLCRHRCRLDFRQVRGTGIDIRWSVGLDGLGVWMFGLSALLFVTAVLVSWESIEERAPLFYAMLLLLEFGCLGVFTARDIILFYIFFEFTLIPLFFLIGIWGSEDRRYAAVKFFLFTLAGSLLTFLGLLAIVLWDYQPCGRRTLRFSIAELTPSCSIRCPPAAERVFWPCLPGFAIKVPLFPLHTWLPLAHVQAPTAGSVILAGILLKIGVYGFLRFSLPMLPEATGLAMPWILWLAAAALSTAPSWPWPNRT
jgi:NADH-quinone oxidoreductase subunit M